MDNVGFPPISGAVLEFSEFWNILVSAGASSSATVLRINVEMVSGPAALSVRHIRSNEIYYVGPNIISNSK